MKDLLSGLANQEAEVGLDPWPPDPQTKISGVRKNRGDFRDDLNLHTIEEITGGNEIGNRRVPGLMEGALAIFQHISHFLEGDIEPAGGHRC